MGVLLRWCSSAPTNEMSYTPADERTDSPANATGFEAIRNNRESLKEHAETDRPTAYIAEELLDLAAEEDA